MSNTVKYILTEVSLYSDVHDEFDRLVDMICFLKSCEVIKWFVFIFTDAINFNEKYNKYSFEIDILLNNIRKSFIESPCDGDIMTHVHKWACKNCKNLYDKNEKIMKNIDFCFDFFKKQKKRLLNLGINFNLCEYILEDSESNYVVENNQFNLYKQKCENDSELIIKLVKYIFDNENFDNEIELFINDTFNFIIDQRKYTIKNII